MINFLKTLALTLGAVAAVVEACSHLAKACEAFSESNRVPTNGKAGDA